MVKDGNMDRGVDGWMVKVRQKDKGDKSTDGKGWKDG
jgi:hypothetical protein